MPKPPQILVVPEKAARYGSSRLGSRKERVCMTCTTATLPAELQGVSYVIRGEKSYELSNHLGNVLAVVSDRREAGSCTDSLVDFYYADGRSVSDYYPFGMAMDSRTQRAGGYRWGFGGHEKMDEVYGSGNSIDMGDRWLDIRLGRTSKIDRKANNYPDVSSYSYAANNPIFFQDPDGEEVRAYTAASRELVIQTLNYAFGGEHGFSYTNGKLVHNGGIPPNLTPQQTLLFTYFNETLVNSSTLTIVNANSSISARKNADGELLLGGIVLDGNAATFFYPESIVYSEPKQGGFTLMSSSTPSTNDIIATSGLIKFGIDLDTESRVRNFSAEHAILHEFAHAIINTIMTEFNGFFNGVNFKEMTDDQRSDWSTQYTNTLLQSMGVPLETGAGQHGRALGDKPDSEVVTPLTQ